MAARLLTSTRTRAPSRLRTPPIYRAPALLQRARADATGLSVQQPGFIAKLTAILGDVRFLWMAGGGDTLTSKSLETATGRVITWDASIASRLSGLGSGSAQTFSSAGSQYGTTPDTANMSFGNGSTDSAFTIVALLNVTNTAANRTIVSKFNAATNEYIFTVTGAADQLSLLIYDNSVPISASRASDAAITQGSWHLFGVTYDGTGGATAANGMTLYQDGAAIASTATNNGTYVAMEDLGAAVEIGSINAHTAQFSDGSMALIAIAQTNLPAAGHAAVKNLVNQQFALSL